MESNIDLIYKKYKNLYANVSIEIIEKCIENTSIELKISKEDSAKMLIDNIREIDINCILSKSVLLKDYQLRVVNYMLNHRGIVIAFDVGKGKTLTAIATANCLSQEAKFLGKSIKIYIITPTSLQENFKKEMRKFGIDPEKSNYNFYTITSFVNAYKRGEIQCNKSLLIIDEAHNLRKDYRLEFSEIKFGKADEDSTRAKTFIECASNAWKVILLTATPSYNAPHDIVNLAAMIKGQNPPLNSYEFNSLMKNETLFKNYFECMFAFEKSPSNKFPAREDKEVYIAMNNKYYKKYSDIENKLKDQNRRKKKKSKKDEEEGKNAFMIKLRKASNDIQPCLKCIFIMRLLGNKLKTVIFSEFISSGINLIKKILEQNNIPYLEITGSTPKNKRHKIVEQINDQEGENNILFITKAGGEGLDLKGIRQVILMEKGWNVASEEQVIGRAVRYESHIHLLKDEQNVIVYHLIMIKPEEAKEYKDTGKIQTAVGNFENMSIKKELSADLFLFTKSRQKQIQIDILLQKLEKYSLENNYDKCMQNL